MKSYTSNVPQTNVAEPQTDDGSKEVKKKEKRVKSQRKKREKRPAEKKEKKPLSLKKPKNFGYKLTISIMTGIIVFLSLMLANATKEAKSNTAPQVNDYENTTDAIYKDKNKVTVTVTNPGELSENMNSTDTDDGVIESRYLYQHNVEVEYKDKKGNEQKGYISGLLIDQQTNAPVNKELAFAKGDTLECYLYEGLLYTQSMLDGSLCNKNTK